MTTAIETTIAAKIEHQIPSALLQKKVQVTVVGCGGTGSAIAAGLPYLHQAMVALGHPHGGVEMLRPDFLEARFWIACGLPTTCPNIFRTSAAGLTY